jgi:DNA-binding XRE family transcriptional regulator
MTKNNVSTCTGPDRKGVRVDLLEPRYTDSERALVEGLQSRINVARALLGARVATGLTQAEVGRAAGTKQSRVSEIEAMKGNPRLDTLDRLAAVLGLAVALVPREFGDVVAMDAGYQGYGPSVTIQSTAIGSPPGSRWRAQIPA